MRFFDEDKLFENYTDEEKERIEQAVSDIMPVIERFDGKHSVGYFSGIWMDDIFYEDMSEDMRFDAASVALQRYKREHYPEEYDQFMAIVEAGKSIQPDAMASDDANGDTDDDTGDDAE